MKNNSLYFIIFVIAFAVNVSAMEMDNDMEKQEAFEKMYQKIKNLEQKTDLEIIQIWKEVDTILVQFPDKEKEDLVGKLVQRSSEEIQVNIFRAIEMMETKKKQINTTKREYLRAIMSDVSDSIEKNSLTGLHTFVYYLDDQSTSS